MPKGRIYAPPVHNEGNWFRHRGVAQEWPPVRTEDTSTGAMITAPFKPFTSAYPPDAPPQYRHKDTVNRKWPTYPQPSDERHSPSRFRFDSYMQKKRNFKLSNNFSDHDNRHSFQTHGVYLGNGRDTRSLGKRIRPGSERQHYTGREYLEFDPCKGKDYFMTTNVDNYRAIPLEEPIVHRRFPRNHKEGVPGDVKLSTSTTSWFRSPDVPYRIPTQVLASSQEPFLPHNSWKFSNHGLAKCYPPYHRGEKLRTYPTWLVEGKVGELKA